MSETQSNLSTGDGGEKQSVKPLQSRTMTLGELQMRTLSVLALVRKQFNRHPYQDGMSDKEFLDHIIDPLETEIRQDRFILKAAKDHEKSRADLDRMIGELLALDKKFVCEVEDE